MKNEINTSWIKFALRPSPFRMLMKLMDIKDKGNFASLDEAEKSEEWKRFMSHGELDEVVRKIEGEDGIA